MRHNSDTLAQQHKTVNHALRISHAILLGALCLSLTACFESNSEQEAPAPVGAGSGGGDGGGTTPPPAVITANNDSLSIAPNSSGDVNIFANDSAETSFTLLSYDTTSTEAGSVNDLGNGVLSYTPATDFVGQDSFSYTIVDSNNNEASATVSVRVDPAVITEGKSYYQKNCAICHQAGSDDTTHAFFSSDIARKQAMLTTNLGDLDGVYQLMGSYQDVAQEDIDRLKAYLKVVPQ